MAFRINNYAAGDTAEVLVYGEVGDDFGGVNAADFYDKVSALDAPNCVTIRINSYGGDVFAGWAVYNQIRKLPQPTTTAVDGIAASIASVIAMAGDTVTVSENGMIMIHNAWTSLSLSGDKEAMAAGSEDLARMTETLQVIDEQIVATYASRVHVDNATIRAWMDEETWFSSADAVRYGFADTITEPLAVAAAHVPDNRYRNTPRHLLRSQRSAVTETPVGGDEDACPRLDGETAEPVDNARLNRAGWRLLLLQRNKLTRKAK